MLIAGLVAACTGACGCTLPYLVRQAAGQVDLLARARPIAEVLRNPALEPETRRGLEEVVKVLEYAARNGFRVGAAYRSYVELGNRPPVYVLSAAPPDSLSSHIWWFPIIGSAPYKGFFDLDSARREQRLLELAGLETRIAPAAAYSSLGWFRDPVFSSILGRGRGAMVETLMHELTHRTWFYPSDLRFNENLASFVGEMAAIQYLESAGDAADLSDYRAGLADQRIFREVVRELRDRLGVAFRSPNRAERLAARDRLFAAANDRLRRSPFQSASFRARGEIQWSIPLLLSFDLYDGESQLFERALALSGGDLGRFLASLEDLPPGRDGVARLRSWVALHEVGAAATGRDG